MISDYEARLRRLEAQLLALKLEIQTLQQQALKLQAAVSLFRGAATS